MYTVIGGYKSRAFRVLWALEELGLEYKHLPVAPHDDAVKEHSALGKIPVLLDGDQAIPDSVAILMHLANKHGGIGAKPGSVERAQQDAMTLRIVDEVDALLWMAARHSFRLPEEHRMPAIKDSLKWEFAQNMDRLADEMGDNEFICGDSFTMADIILTHCGGWAITAKFPKTHKPKFADYFRRMVAREGYQKARGD